MDSRCRVRAKPRDAEPWFERRCEEHSWLDMEERTAPAPRYKRRGGRTSVFIGRRPALAALVLLCLPAAAQRGRCPAGPAAGAEELAAVARGLAEGGQLGEAFACEERLRVLAPNDPAGFGLSAQTCLAGGDAACCEAMAAHALSLARGSSADGAALARLRVLAGNCAVAAARWGDAEAHYAAAAAEGAAGGGLGGEELAGALNNLGNVRRMQRDWTGAAAAYSAAARAAPGFADAHFNAGGAILEAGGAADPAKAVAPLATALALAAQWQELRCCQCSRLPLAPGVRSQTAEPRPCPIHRSQTNPEWMDAVAAGAPTAQPGQRCETAGRSELRARHCRLYCPQAIPEQLDVVAEAEPTAPHGQHCEAGGPLAPQTRPGLIDPPLLVPCWTASPLLPLVATRAG